MKPLLKYFSANLEKLYFLLIVLLFLILIYPWYWNGLYGFDWTDTTYHFQQALNVYNGASIGADFQSHTPGLSFWMEAQLFKIFGADFMVHRQLGLLFPFLVMLSLAAIFEHNLKDLRLPLRAIWVSSLSSVAVTSIWGNQLYFSFTDLAGAISFIIAALIILTVNTKHTKYLFIYIFFISISISVQILVSKVMVLLILFFLTV